jgi:VWFA-related protein
MRTQIAGSSAVFLAIIALAHTQRPAPTFHAEIDYVEFPVRVTGGSGDLVHDLPQSDFQVFEDGKPQTIETFSSVEVPMAVPAVAGGMPPRHDITDPNELAQVPGRIYLFVFDDYHMAAEDLPAAKRIVERFIRDRLTDDDRAAVMTASGSGVEFTGDRERLLSAVDRFAGHKQADIQPPAPAARAAFEALSERERTSRAQGMLQTISQASTWLQRVRGRRKILFLITNEAGCNVVPDSPRSFRDPCGQSLPDALRAAQIADVSIYPLHTQGLNIADCRQAGYAGGVSDECGGLAGTRVRGVFSALSVLATETGGFMIHDTNNLEGAFDRVLRENSFYYLVGYYSTNENHNGKFRKTEIRLARKDLHALYRPGYTAPRVP